MKTLIKLAPELALGTRPAEAGASGWGCDFRLPVGSSAHFAHERHRWARSVSPTASPAEPPRSLDGRGCHLTRMGGNRSGPGLWKRTRVLQSSTSYGSGLGPARKRTTSKVPSPDPKVPGVPPAGPRFTIRGTAVPSLVRFAGGALIRARPSHRNPGY